MKSPKLPGIAPILGLALFSVPGWAETQVPGIPNFHQVNEQLYRGGQPSGEGWRSLAKLGVKTVIDLRRENEDGEHSVAAERKAVEAAGMRYISVPMNGAPAAPTDAQITKIMDLLGSRGPAFVHCKKGKDRTGAVIACYRMQYEGWRNGKALDEAKSLGLHWYEVGMKGYIRDFKPAREVANAGQ